MIMGAENTMRSGTTAHGASFCRKDAACPAASVVPSIFGPPDPLAASAAAAAWVDPAPDPAAWAPAVDPAAAEPVPPVVDPAAPPPDVAPREAEEPGAIPDELGVGPMPLGVTPAAQGPAPCLSQAGGSGAIWAR